MSALEQDVRSTLKAVADEAPSDLGLLSRVQARTQRRSRVRRIGAVTAAAALAVGAVLLATLPSGHSSAVRYATQPGEFFMDGSSLELRFPYTARVLPDGDQPSQVALGRDHDVLTATWRQRDSNVVSLSVTASPRDPRGIVDQPTSVTSMTVRGHTGRLACDAGGCELSWQETPGRWLDVFYQPVGHKGGPSLREIAEHLVRREVVQRPVLKLGVVPNGCVLGSADAVGTVLTGEKACLRVSASTFTGALPQRPGGKLVTIAGHPGSLAVQGRDVADPIAPKSYLVDLSLGDGRVLEVSVPWGNGWDEPLLRYFVEHLRIPPA